MTKVMKHVEAHELVNADRGVHIVATTLAITYVGWFQNVKEHGDGWVTVHLEDFMGLRVSLLLPSRSHVHIEPFPPLAVGDIVVRAGYSDPESRNFRRAQLGQVEQIGRSSAGDRVYAVAWEGELERTWTTRRRIEVASSQMIEEIRAVSAS